MVGDKWGGPSGTDVNGEVIDGGGCDRDVPGVGRHAWNVVPHTGCIVVVHSSLATILSF